MMNFFLFCMQIKISKHSESQCIGPHYKLGRKILASFGLKIQLVKIVLFCDDVNILLKDVYEWLMRNMRYCNNKYPL